jgi:hypothetical protein
MATMPSPSKKHWAFVPVKPVAVPSEASGWSPQPLDRFIKRELYKQGLTPVEQADKRTLIRRAYFDLIGLPPSPQEIDAFVADESPDAWPKLIEKLLASPRYGERWGRHWMDLVHYADTAGGPSDYPVPQAAWYRDYIIDSFNADKPYDQFIKEQLPATSWLARPRVTANTPSRSWPPDSSPSLAVSPAARTPTCT